MLAARPAYIHLTPTPNNRTIVPHYHIKFAPAKVAFWDDQKPPKPSTANPLFNVLGQVPGLDPQLIWPSVQGMQMHVSQKDFIGSYGLHLS